MTDLETYVSNQIQQGVSLSTVKVQLIEAGWTEASLRQYAPDFFGNSMPSRGVWLISGFIVLAIVVIAGFFIAADRLLPTLESNNFQQDLGQDDTEVATYTLNDTNFTMQVADGWTQDASYESGQRTIFMYSPEDASDENRPMRALLNVYVGIDFDRQKLQTQQLQDLESYEVLQDRDYEEFGVQYSLLEASFAAQETPDNVMRFMMITAQRGDFRINAEVISAEQHWGLHAEEAEAMLTTIVPACDTISPIDRTMATQSFCEG